MREFERAVLCVDCCAIALDILLVRVDTSWPWLCGRPGCSLSFSRVGAGMFCDVPRECGYSLLLSRFERGCARDPARCVMILAAIV